MAEDQELIDWVTAERAKARERGAELKLVSRALPRLLAAYAAHRDPAPLLAQRGLPPDAHRQPELEVPLELLRDLSEQVATELARPFLGLELAATMPPTAFGLLELSMRAAPNLGEGLQRLVRVSAKLGSVETFELATRGDFAELSHRVPGTRRALGRQGNELLLAWLLRLVREVVGRPWTPTEVCLAHAAPPEPRLLQVHFGGKGVHFAMGFNALRFSASTLAWPSVSADPALAEMVEEQAQRRLGQSAEASLLTRLQEQIRQELNGGRPTLESVAAALRISTRTLQRRLDAHHTSFNQLVEELRLGLAKEYLANPRLSSKEIGLMLGYADPGTFIRAFKRVTGVTPMQYREKAR